MQISHLKTACVSVVLLLCCCAVQQRGANVNLVDRWGGTPLLDAVKAKHDGVAELLRAHGAELRMDTSAGSNVLLTAAAAGDAAAVTRYLTNGLSPNLADYDGRTAAHLAACSGKWICFLRTVVFFRPISLTCRRWFTIVFRCFVHLFIF